MMPIALIHPRVAACLAAGVLFALLVVRASAQSNPDDVDAQRRPIQALLVTGGEVWQEGVIVHAQEFGVTDLLDFTPGSQGAGNTADYIDTRDGALTLGNSFTFPNDGPTLIPVAIGETDGWQWIDVQIIPEPSAATLLLVGSMWLLGVRRPRHRMRRG